MDGAHQVGVEWSSLYGIVNFVVVPISNAVVRGPAIDLWTWLDRRACLPCGHPDSTRNPASAHRSVKVTGRLGKARSAAAFRASAE